MRWEIIPIKKEDIRKYGGVSTAMRSVSKNIQGENTMSNPEREPHHVRLQQAVSTLIETSLGLLDELSAAIEGISGDPSKETRTKETMSLQTCLEQIPDTLNALTADIREKVMKIRSQLY